MTYDWKCVTCGFVRESPLPTACPQCGVPMRKKYSVHTPAPSTHFQPHFTRSLGQWVTSMADFRAKLSARSDAMSERLGIDHAYAPHDHSDRLGVTEE